MGCLSISQHLANLSRRDKHIESPSYLFIQTLYRIAQCTDEGKGARFMLQDKAQQRCITIDVLGPPRVAPSAEVSYCRGDSVGDELDAKAAALGEPPRRPESGPVVPI